MCYIKIEKFISTVSSSKYLLPTAVKQTAMCETAVYREQKGKENEESPP